MDYENPLDNIIRRFQHRWETDRQYRAAMSGVLGLVMILVLCTGVGALSMIGTRALAAVGVQLPGSTNNGSANINTDTGVVVGDTRQFPTATIATWAVPGVPASSPIASSLTPQPSPTPLPTATDAPTSTPCSSCHGNGGGGTPAGAITASWSPTTWTSGQSGAAFTVHATDTSGNPKAGVGIAIIYTWSSNKTWLDENGATTDGSGNYTSHPTVGNCPGSHTMSAYVQAFFPAGKVENTWQIPCF